jgi:hypothetical protein
MNTLSRWRERVGERVDGLARCNRLKRAEHLIQDITKSLIYFVVPKVDNAKSAFRQKFVALQVLDRALDVLTTVDFDHQSC